MSRRGSLRALAVTAAWMLSVALLCAAAADADASSSASGCAISGGFTITAARAPSELATALEPGVLANFGVLRRAALPQDAIPALSSVGSGLDFQLSGYYPSYVRRIATLGTSRYYVIPAFLRALPVPPAACLPKSVRSRRAQLVEAERRRASEPADCIVEVGGRQRYPGNSDPCESFTAAGSSPRVFHNPIAAGVAVELVPDGVASVRVTRPQGAPQIVEVSENAYALQAPAWRRPPIRASTWRRSSV